MQIGRAINRDRAMITVHLSEEGARVDRDKRKMLRENVVRTTVYATRRKMTGFERSYEQQSLSGEG